MAKRLSELTDSLTDFIAAQKLFFVGTAAPDGHVNVSPKGMDSLRVLGSTRVAWLNVTGSGNETAAHVAIAPRMTILFCAFDGPPMILRLYGTARAIHHNDPEWPELIARFPTIPGARQIFDLSIDLVQTSCGFAVPLYDYVEDRSTLRDWATRKGDAGIADYWREKNVTSLDGLPTDIVKKNL